MWFNFNKEDKKAVSPEEKEAMEKEKRAAESHMYEKESLAVRDKEYRETNEKLDAKNEIKKLEQKLKNSENADIKSAVAVLAVLSQSLIKGNTLDIADSVLKLPLSSDTYKKVGGVLNEDRPLFPDNENEPKVPQEVSETIAQIGDLAQKLKNSEDADIKSAAAILAVLSQSLKEGNVSEFANSVLKM
jgi:hypothetical protein